METNVKRYSIETPAIPTGNVYMFTTDAGVRYEVRFGRKQDNFLWATIVFGVLNEEYEGEEYVVTNKGDIYKVMATISDIVKMYIEQHPNVSTYEFCGEPNKNTPADEPTTRTKLYIRYLNYIFGPNWTREIMGNRVIVSRKKK
jgi:hypothetical protein